MITPLSLAVHHGAVNCVAYLKEMGARSYDRLTGSGGKIWEFGVECGELNTLQFSSLKYGRDSLITRLVRGERKEIAKSYKLGFAALRYYADNQRASLLLAKNDGRLWLLLKGLAIVEMPMEIREKIVDFAFFGKDAPERNKAVEDKSEEEDEDESEEEDEDESDY